MWLSRRQRGWRWRTNSISYKAKLMNSFQFTDTCPGSISDPHKSLTLLACFADDDCELSSRSAVCGENRCDSCDAINVGPQISCGTQYSRPVRWRNEQRRGLLVPRKWKTAGAFIFGNDVGLQPKARRRVNGDDGCHQSDSRNRNRCRCLYFFQKRFRNNWFFLSRGPFHSTAFHLEHAPFLRAGLGPVAVTVTGPGSSGLAAR